MKLRVPSGALSRVARQAWLRAMVSGPIRQQRLVSVYFDTRKFKLRDEGISLRVRHAGGRTLQTVKAAGNGSAGTLGRAEWEQEIGGDTPDLAAAADTELGRLANGKLARQLRPVFETAVRRTTIPLHVGDSDLELAIDRGQIKVGDDSEPISEIEIELKRGDSREVGRIAGRIAGDVPASYFPLSKPARGYALREGHVARAVHAGPIVLDAAMSTGECFRIVAQSCLDQLAANEDAVRAGDGGGIHQMRVGLRRLRAAMSVFKDVARNSQLDAVKSELKWLTEQLGPARELDVFVEEGIVPLGEEEPGEPGVDELAHELERRRADAFAQAKVAVDSDRYRRLVLDTTLWLIDGEWSSDPDRLRAAARHRPVREFATEVLAVRARKVVKKSRKLRELEPRQLHKLRIAAKKLRYASEFFDSLYGGAKAKRRKKRVANALKTLQGALGKLNDINVHGRMRAELISDGEHKPKLAYALGLAAEREHQRVAACLAAAAKAARSLAEDRPFWR
ncbi:MAG: CHAD domain-containing protein [Alphaproteobacteria bacterium]|nr:CHAD domain-containing protein [Alphaproteobacteria bacterium]